MRYIDQQKHEFTCGPVAIINALRWWGVKADYDNFLLQLEPGECTERFGMKWKTLSKVLKRNGFKVKQVYNPTMRELDAFLADGLSIILNYSYIDPEDGMLEKHYVFIDAKWRIFNGHDIDRSIMAKYFITAKRRVQKPKAWVILNHHKEHSGV